LIDIALLLLIFAERDMCAVIIYSACCGGATPAAPLTSPLMANKKRRRGSMTEEQALLERDAAGSGEAELRRDSMMAHLLDSLQAGRDIGHYGRLVFVMVARHFMTNEEVLSWLMRDPDFAEPDATIMLRQVEGKDYNPPRRERLLEWQAQQEFPILPYPDDPDCGNLYRNLKFPDAIYDHISHYQEQKAASGSPDAG
jgi:hypothetical protein